MNVGKSLGRMTMGDSTIFFDSLKKSMSLRKHSALLPQKQDSKASGPSISPGFWVPVLTMESFQQALRLRPRKMLCPWWWLHEASALRQFSYRKVIPALGWFIPEYWSERNTQCLRIQATKLAFWSV